MKRITIAIDGFSSCGKSTMAKELARKLGYIYIDTGAMYRAVTLFCIENGFIENGDIKESDLKDTMSGISVEFRIDPDNNTPEILLNGRCVEKEIRTMGVSEKVSIVSAIPFVREAMVKLQRIMGNGKGVVMDGRDIGTAVFPDAELKIFVTASPDIRAQRRFDEMKAKGIEASFEEILKNVKERDFLDQTRSVSPLKKADNAILLDNSFMSISEQDKWLMDQYHQVVNY